jgi:DNA-binding MarR family transcriptional regulator
MSMQHSDLFAWYRTCAASIHGLPHELTMRQWALLCHIYLLEGEHSVTSLAYSFDLPKGSISRALDSLVIAGLVKRHHDTQDKRQVFMRKTMKGIAFLNQFSDILAKESYLLKQKTYALYNTSPK